MLDVAFNASGNRIASASADGTVRVYDAASFECIAILTGHESEVSKVRKMSLEVVDSILCFHICILEFPRCFCFFRQLEVDLFQVVFNPQGTRLLTASSDKTARLWDLATAKCIKVSREFAHRP